MVRVKLVHIRNKTQSLESKWRKGIDVPDGFFRSMKTHYMTNSEIWVYVALIHNRDFDKHTTALYPTITMSYTDLTEYIGIYDRKTVRECIKKLEAKKLITVDRRCLTNVYTLLGYKTQVETTDKGKLRSIGNIWDAIDGVENEKSRSHTLS